jgi:hypothetical protein
MILMFGKETVDTKGLPAVAVINTHAHDGNTTVHVLLTARTRAAVEKWAKRLGVPAIETDGYCAEEREVCAEAESDGNRLRVYTYVPAGGAS